MKRRNFDMPNKMLISSTTGGPSTDSFYNFGPVPDGTEVTIDAGTLATPSASLYVTLKDHGYYNEVSIIINMLNGATLSRKRFCSIIGMAMAILLEKPYRPVQ